MRFHVGQSPQGVQPGDLILATSNWDDWFKFETSFMLSYKADDGEIYPIGFTKIGQIGLKGASAVNGDQEGYRRPCLPSSFETLSESFFSLGQDTTFYVNLTNAGEDFRERVLKALRDIAYDSEIFKVASREDVTKVSLLRDIPLLTVHEQYARLARGGALLTDYRFTFRMATSGSEHLEVDFTVQPGSTPPTNIHVLIGRNGVGKSTLLHNLAGAFVGGRVSTGNLCAAPESQVSDIEIANLVSVSFSAFDVFKPIPVSQDRTKGLTYQYIGLKKIESKKEEGSTKDFVVLSREMTISAKACLQGASSARWLRAIRLLESDPIFAEADLSRLIEENADAFIVALPDIFRRLSSGHKIVLLTITRLVETVVEKSLVLLDEPEAHLHPPLLSAFVRALSDLLTNRNGLAIIATHSPVVLQEVPRSCVWKLQRWGNSMSADRPDLETFGENVGILTDEVFGLEVTATGFHTMLAEAAQHHATYEEALDSFEGQLGAEGKAILRARMAVLRPRDSHVDS